MLLFRIADTISIVSWFSGREDHTVRSPQQRSGGGWNQLMPELTPNHIRRSSGPDIDGEAVQRLGFKTAAKFGKSPQP
ncbi:hypothetical protein A2U01_0017819, partial [Trifolium medium]|nr:hypothetical protein [Trifolium medium]